MHHFLPSQSAVSKLILDVWADKIEEDSNGRIKIERYPSMQLGGKPSELIDQVIDGAVDIAWGVNGYTPGRFPHSEVFELPFIMNNSEATSRAYWQLFQQEPYSQDFKDVKLLFTWVHGPGLIHSNHPINDIGDLKGVKLRAPNYVITSFFEQLGAIVIGMPAPSVPEALSKRVIDGCALPWEITSALKIPELVKNHTEFRGDRALYTITFILAMNREKFASLPDDLKAIIEKNSGLEFSAFAGRTHSKADEPARQLAVNFGNKIITFDKRQTAKWEKLAQIVHQEWIKSMEKRGLDGKTLLEKARKLIDENNME